MEQEPSNVQGEFRLIAHAEACNFQLPDGVQAHDPKITHFHFTHPSIIFDPSTKNDYHGPAFPWDFKEVASKRARIIARFQVKAASNRTLATETREQAVINGVGGRIVKEQVDASLPKEWFHLCESSHGMACKDSPPARKTGPSLVIDVTKSCIVATPANCRYVALSYVWGTAPVFRHLKANSQKIRQPGSLDKAQLPATIRDSMLLVREMGERYLWVDSICIIQDDFGNQQAEIMRMGSIYSMAIFTVIVAFGDGANSGLPGVRPGTRKRVQQTLRIGDKELLTVIDNEGANEGVEDSIWSTRAWTFQERLLSKRVLVFTKTQVYWSCRSTFYSEEFAAEKLKNVRLHHFSVGQARLDQDLPEQPLSADEFVAVYDRLVTAYRQRRLTYQSDILNAFTGVSEILSIHQKTDYIWGLPRKYFSYGLSWHFIGYHKRHDEKFSIVIEQGKEPSETPVPTWSWAAWSGEKNLPWLAIGSWDLKQGNIRIDIVAEINLHIVDNKGHLVKIEQQLPEIRGDSKSKRLLEAWRCADGPMKAPEKCVSNLKIGQLHCWTSVASLRVIRQELEEPQPSYCSVYPPEDDPHLFEGIGSTPKMIMGLTAHIKGEKPELHSKIWSLMTAKYRDGADMISLDFVVVAKRQTLENEAANLMTLVVEWKEGVAYRLGIAWIPEQAWIKLKREWKYVVLG